MIPPNRVLILAFDIEEASQRRSIGAIRDTGAEVTVAGYFRGNMADDAVPEGCDINLGICPNGVGWARLSGLTRGALRMWRARGLIGKPSVVVVRNLDLALLGLLVLKMMALRGSGQPRLVYQCLDIHRLMTAQGPAGRLARWVERRVLARTSLLVVSAPRFLSEYFVSRQGYHGPVQVVENRIVWSTSADAPPRPVWLPKRSDGPITIGWVGTLRCPQTLDLLQSAVEQAGPQTLRVVLRGVVHHHQLPGFDKRIGTTPGLSYAGPYKYPAGLKSAYDGLDYVWAQDLWQRGANSDWLLPNRLYEAGFFGCPMLALAGTATGDRVRSWRSGVTLLNARPEDLVQAVPRLRALRNELARNLLALPAETFAQDKGEVATMLGLVDVKRSDRSDAPPIADLACASRAHVRQGRPAGT